MDELKAMIAVVQLYHDQLDEREREFIAHLSGPHPVITEAQIKRLKEIWARLHDDIQPDRP